MTKKDYNRDYWCIHVSPFSGRRPVSYDILCLLLGHKIFKIFRKLEINKKQKLIIRPFHGEVYIFYRH